MKKPIHIMLIEDHPEFRESIALILGKESDLKLESQFGTAEQALRLVQNQTDEERPDLVLLDLNLPGMTGIEALPWFKTYSPKTKIIVLTQSSREADILAAISAGASGYLLKGAKRRHLSEAIHNVMEGGAMLDPGVAQFILKKLNTQAPEKTSTVALSEREQETLALLGEGLVKKEIADRLGVTPHTVATFIKRIYEKLNVPNAPAAVSKAFRTGILPSNASEK